MDIKNRIVEYEVMFELNKILYLENMSLSTDERTKQLYSLDKDFKKMFIDPRVDEVRNNLFQIFNKSVDNYGIKLFMYSIIVDFSTDEWRQWGLEIYRDWMLYNDKSNNKFSDVKNESILDNIPSDFQTIMKEIGNNKVPLEDLPDFLVKERLFMSHYLIYKTNDLVAQVGEDISKTQFLQSLEYAGPCETKSTYNIMASIQKKYPKIFEKVTPEVSYDTAKKRMQKVLPSQKVQDSTDQSHYLNIYERQALATTFLIYPTKYQRFLSNTERQKAPSYKEVQDIKNIIMEFLLEYPDSLSKSSLFARTSLEDTYHFALLNALTKLIAVSLEFIYSMSNDRSENDSLSLLFVIDEIITNIEESNLMWESKFDHFKNEIRRFASNSYDNEVIHNILSNSENIKIAEQTMAELLHKYDTPYIESESSSITDSDIENLFEFVIKHFYRVKTQINAFHE